jgi:type I restriction enzyme S subunit
MRRGPYPYYGAASVMDYIDNYLFQGPHLLIAEDGSVEGPFGAPLLQLVDGQFWVNNHAHVLTCESRDDLRYLFYALSTVRVRPYLTGSVQAKLSQGNMNRIPVPYPDRVTRHGIVAILGALDDKIELNRKMSATLEAMVRALFKSWFVDFDPVRAKAEGREPVLPPEIAALFPDSFQDSELGEIPRGWSIEPVASIAELSRTAINPATCADEVFHHYSIPAFDAGRLPAVELGIAIKSNKLFVPKDSVLVSRLNPRMPRVWWTEVNGAHRSICSTEFAVMNTRTLPREWLYCLLSSAQFCEELSTMVTGTSGSHQRVKPESLLAMQILAPPQSVATSFSSIAAPLLSRGTHCLNESKTLGATRDALLPKLISGEIRVSDAERLVEQSA